ncbi:MAG: hypothetical protein P9F75_06080 [Candidatus Contendobacter sp.]|nr:hypothetical protein [Candidatus Contendobacter sp.]
MDAITDSSLISAERSRALTATLWFRLIAVMAILVVAAFRRSPLVWILEEFALVALPLFGYNLAALLGRNRLALILTRRPGWLVVDLAVSITLLTIGDDWRNSYLFYTLTTLILFTIFLNRQGVWTAAILFAIATLIKDLSGDAPAMETFVMTPRETRLSVVLLCLCAGLILGYFDTLLSRIERLAREQIIETQRRVTIEEHQRLALGLHDGAKQMVLALLLRSRGLLRRQEWDEVSARQELEWLWRGLSYLQIELNHLVKTLLDQESAPAWEVDAIVREEIRLVTALTGGHWTLDVSMTEPTFLSTRHRDALRHFLAEALMNTWKHAGVAAGEVELRQGQNEIMLAIADRGCGFDPATSGNQGTVGLHSLRHRAQELGGNLELKSQPNAGCRLVLWFPVHPPAV